MKYTREIKFHRRIIKIMNSKCRIQYKSPYRREEFIKCDYIFDKLFLQQIYFDTFCRKSNHLKCLFWITVYQMLSSSTSTTNCIITVLFFLRYCKITFMYNIFFSYFLNRFSDCSAQHFYTFSISNIAPWIYFNNMYEIKILLNNTNSIELDLILVCRSLWTDFPYE